MALRFLLDENQSPVIAVSLRAQGVSAVSAIEARLAHTDDLEIIEYARGAGLVVVTNDVDFLVHAASGVDHAGIAFYPQRSLTFGQVVQYLLLMDACYEPAEMAGRVEYLSG